MIPPTRVGRLAGDNRPTVGRLTGEYRLTKDRQLPDTFTGCVAHQSPDCRESVGLMLVKCQLLVWTATLDDYYYFTIFTKYHGIYSLGTVTNVEIPCLTFRSSLVKTDLF